MKTNEGFIIGCAALFVLMILLQLSLPHQYSWTETHGNDDAEPYGSMVFDSVMQSNMPEGYGVTGKKLSEIADGSHNVLIAGKILSLSDDDGAALRKMLANGAKVMIAVTDFADDQTDSILANDYGAIFYKYKYNDIEDFIRKVNDNSSSPYDTIIYNVDNDIFTEEFHLYEFMFNSCLVTERGRPFDDIASLPDTAFVPAYAGKFFQCNQRRRKKIMQEKDSVKRAEELEEFAKDFDPDYYRVGSCMETSTVATELNVGKGKIIFVASALPFTNYGILSRRNTRLTSLLMARLADKPTLRCTIADNRRNDMNAFAEKSPLDYIFSQPALSDAWRLALLTIILFMVFKARRRQRVIPIYNAPRNYNLEFIKLVGSLYWQQHDNNDLLGKKYAAFAEAVRKSIATDIYSQEDDAVTSSRIAALTGMTSGEVAEFLKNLRFLSHNELQISDEEMKKNIDMMNKITEKLS